MYTATIGLEIHAELKTKSKMFCGCKNDPQASEPNVHTCPVCLAHPGTLPVANFAAIKSVITFGTAVGGTVATYSEFDRKNYFYPDIPKAYQISQYAFPLVKGGKLLGVQLTRVHLEEDTARSQHDKGDYSLIDFNRAGVPLMELVTEPIIHTPKEASAFARELQLLLRTLNISDANMEKGEMRVEANISVSNSAELGTKVEVKNLNSFKSVELAIAYEIDRQMALLEKGETIHQATCGWDEVNLKTVIQRSKETAKDYRYFPDPDLPKLQVNKISGFSAENCIEMMPELPQEKRIKYNDIGLTSNQIETIIQNPLADTYFSMLYTLAQTDTNRLKLAVNYLLTDLVPLITNTTGTNFLSPKHFLDLIDLLVQKKITSRVAKDLIIELALTDIDIVKVITERNLMSDFDERTLLEIVKTIIKANATVATEYKAGKVTSLQYLLGQAMKATRGAADPATLKNLFESELR